MRVRNVVLFGSISMVSIAILAAGCGGDDTTAAPASDAGNVDVTTAADVGSTADTAAPPQDTGAGGSDSGSTCVEDASLATLSPPDADIADGASSTGICLGCVHGNCGTELNACAADCACNNAIEDVIKCVFAGGAVLSCGGPVVRLTGNSQTLGFALAQCLATSCKNQCVPGLDAGIPTDAAADAPDAD